MVCLEMDRENGEAFADQAWAKLKSLRKSKH
jgi:hypothetical protein